MATKRYLTCSCCGRDAGRWEQHWNRDTGYGVCRPCVDWMLSLGDTPEQIERDYGKEGLNYAVKEAA